MYRTDIFAVFYIREVDVLANVTKLKSNNSRFTVTEL